MPLFTNEPATASIAAPLIPFRPASYRTFRKGCREPPFAAQQNIDTTGSFQTFAHTQQECPITVLAQRYNVKVKQPANSPYSAATMRVVSAFGNGTNRPAASSQSFSRKLRIASGQRITSCARNASGNAL